LPEIRDEDLFGAPGGTSDDDLFGPTTNAPVAQSPQGRLAAFVDRFFPKSKETGRREGFAAGLARQTVGLDQPLDEDLELTAQAAGAVPVPNVPPVLAQAIPGELAQAVQNFRKIGKADSLLDKALLGIGSIPFIGTPVPSVMETGQRGDISGALGEAVAAFPFFKLAKAGIGMGAKALAGRAAAKAAAGSAAKAAAEAATKEALQRQVLDELLQAEAREFPIAPPRAAETLFEGSAEQAARQAGITGPETAAREALERSLPGRREPMPSGLDALEREGEELIPQERAFDPAQVPVEGEPAGFIPEGFDPRTGRPFGPRTSELNAPPGREGPEFDPALGEPVPDRELFQFDPSEPSLAPPQGPTPRLPQRETLPGEAGEGLAGLGISQPGKPLPRSVVEGVPFSLPETGVTPAQLNELAAAIQAARKATAATTKLRRQAAGERFAELESRLAKGESIDEARRAMGGPMPSAPFEGVKIPDEQLRAYKAQIANAPVSGSTKLAANDGFNKLVEGRVLQRSEIKAIEEVLGPRVAEAAGEHTAKEGVNWLKAVVGLPRDLFAGGPELSPWQRQLGLSVAGHPRIGFGSLKKGLTVLAGTPSKHRAVLEELYEGLAKRPNASLYDEAGLKFVDIPTATNAGKTAAEGVAINPIIEAIPGVSNVYRRSAKASAAMINAQRADVFDAIAEPFLKEGKTAATDPELFKTIGQWVNVTTGRGSLGPAEKYAELLSYVIFSPRYLAARAQIPAAAKAMMKADPRLRKEALSTLFNWFAQRAAILGSLKIAKEMGAPFAKDVEFSDDPLSGDFGKARFGKVRLDLWGGNLQLARTLYRLSRAALNLGGAGLDTREKLSGDRVQESMTDIAMQFARGQANPGPRLAFDYLASGGKLKNPAGDEMGITDVINDNFVSGIVQGTRELVQEDPAKVWLVPALALGHGTQVYDEPAQLTEAERKQLRETEAVNRKNTALRKEVEPHLQRESKTPAERLAKTKQSNTRLEGVRVIIALLQQGDKSGARREAARIKRESKGRVQIDIRALEAALDKEVQ
jgi:hypothetical protein